jgi:hypothetical protein
LDTIQALIRQHQVFETDLAAVKEQVWHMLSILVGGSGGVRVCNEYMPTGFLFFW